MEIEVTFAKFQFNTNLDFVVLKYLGIEFSLMSSLNHLVDGKEQEKTKKPKFFVENKTQDLIELPEGKKALHNK